MILIVCNSFYFVKNIFLNLNSIFLRVFEKYLLEYFIKIKMLQLIQFKFIIVLIQILLVTFII